MNYTSAVRGAFLKRLNRFAALADIGGRSEVVHVKNTGRLRELLEPGAPVYLECAGNPARKYRYSLIAVENRGIVVNIDSQAPNAVVYEALRDGKVEEFGDIRIIKREAAYGGSRFDLYVEGDEGPGFIEVKGVTLAKGGIALFPDAPTARGTKHVQELIAAAAEGYRGAVFFLVQREDCRRFAPNVEMDGPFAEALQAAVEHGIRVLAYDAKVTASSIEIGKPLIVDIAGKA
jgi:sugar fermentation stimulation protein A